MARYGYSFPAIRGLQAGREYYASMCALRLLPKVFTFDEEEIAPELRAQRTLNRARIPEMSRYVLNNPEDYVFSAITASIDGSVRFEPLAADEDHRLGVLHVDMDARFVVNDGQHRRAAIEAALRERPELGEETIAVVFFMDQGLRRSQQMFADLNRYAIRPSKSLGVLYDHRDDIAELVRTAILRSETFRGLVELERTTLSARSGKLFTLSSLYSGTMELLEAVPDMGVTDQSRLAVEFWEAVATHMREWVLVRDRKITAGEVRRDYIHSHGTVFQALGRAGAGLYATDPAGWKARLVALESLDWSRTNASLWEGRTVVGGRVAKSRQNIILTTNAIKSHLDLALTPDEQRHEDAHRRSHHGR